MWEDPIVAEVRRIREEHAAQFGYDLDAIFRDLKDLERQSGATFVTFPPRRPRYYGAADPLRPQSQKAEHGAPDELAART